MQQGRQQGAQAAQRTHCGMLIMAGNGSLPYKTHVNGQPVWAGPPRQQVEQQLLHIASRQLGAAEGQRAQRRQCGCRCGRGRRCRRLGYSRGRGAGRGCRSRGGCACLACRLGVW